MMKGSGGRKADIGLIRRIKFSATNAKGKAILLSIAHFSSARNVAVTNMNRETVLSLYIATIVVTLATTA